MTSRRKFIQGAAVVPAAALAAPALAQNTIRWRMQTYAGAALAEMLIARIKNPDAAPTECLWETEFVVGSSTGRHKD